MFVYFTKNKLKYEKGQLTPFFILILVVLIIMSMVTMNLSKVASIRTEASNAADAGALGASSVMARVFNAVALQNSQLEYYYDEFMAAAALSFALAFYDLATAMTLACPKPCGARPFVSESITVIYGLMVAVTGYWAASEYFYCSIRDMADKGQDSAVDAGHGLIFANSGIGSKIKKGEQRDNFSDFLKNIDDGKEEYTYSWEDGQARAHSVKSRLHIDELEDYDLHTTVLPYAAEMALLGAALWWAYDAENMLTLACACEHHYCKAVACAAAKSAIVLTMELLAAAAAGLPPAFSVNSSNCTDALPWIITWIDDIEHNRLVEADTWQKHEGADLGLWQTRYPDTHSLSWADFRGNGSIHPPVLRHDASLIKTDQLGVDD
jgi:hypothetical protein